MPTAVTNNALAGDVWSFGRSSAFWRSQPSDCFSRIQRAAAVDGRAAVSILAILGLAAVGLGVGCLIGCVGIGGVLLVPTLTYLFGVSVHTAIPVAMVVYIASGAVGAVIYARQGSIQWRPALLIVAGATPAAFLGALAVSETPGIWLEVLIAVLIVFAGIHAMRGGKGQAKANGPKLGTLALLGLGAVTGLGSAMTGTGGPLVLVPLTVWLGFPALTAVGFSQAVSMPVAISATVGNLLYGSIDWTLAAVLAPALIIGTGIGAKLAHAVPAEILRRILAWVLVAVGAFILSKLGLA